MQTITVINQSTALEARKELLANEAVLNVLSDVEKNVLKASAKIPIRDIQNEVFVERVRELLKYIAIDVGYNIPTDATEWQYRQTRLASIIKTYYSNLTLSGIKLAFELLVVGELDDYLPRENSGRPDRKHYQQFNADYFAKVLGAYRSRLNEVLTKAYTAIKATRQAADETAEQIAEWRRLRSERNRMIYLRYKYTGVLELIFTDEKFVYEWLEQMGLVTGFSDYKIEDLTVQFVKKKQSERKKKIMLAFNYMIKYEWQV